MSNLVISVLRLPPELFWDDDPATRHRHETFRRLAADRVEYLEAQVEACSARNSSDADRIAELESEAALSRDMVANAEKLVSAVQTDYYDARRRVIALEDALRPFAAEAREWSNVNPDTDVPLVCDVGDDPEPACFTVGDLRRARAVLNQEEGG